MTQSCPNCGSLNREGYRFCSTCGARNAALDVQTPDNLEPSAPSRYAVQSWEDAPVASPRTDSAGVFTPPQLPGTSIEPSVPLPPPPAPAYTTRQPYDARDLPPLGADRPREATYAPYTETAVRQIERSEGNRSWLMPVVMLSGLLLVVLAGAALYLLYFTPGNG
jgi:hypothetical protein